MAQLAQRSSVIAHPDGLTELQAENARLIALLVQHGIHWRAPDRIEAPPPRAIEPSRLSTDEKVSLFRRLFRGRADVYALRWESKAGKSGYAPACANEWKPGICEKPRIKCAACPHQQFLPVTDKVVHEHLAGKITVGIYPLLQDDSCYFLAVDFDEADWQEDAQAFPTLNRNDVHRIDLTIPAAELMQEFDEVAKLLLQQIAKLDQQSQKHRDARDLLLLLLPRLMSGEITV